MAFFPTRIRQLAHLQRWSLMPMLRPDMVASHSFFVAVYAAMLADLIDWEGPRHRLFIHALLHDVDEALTGEMCWFAKKELIDKDRWAEYAAEQMAREMPEVLALQNKTLQDDGMDKEIRTITKCADRLDAALCAATESAFGNGAMGVRLPKCIDLLKQAWSALPHKDMTSLNTNWHRVVMASIRAHQDSAQHDVEPVDE